MNKNTFMDELKYYVKSLPVEEKEEIIQDFNEYFEIGIAEGKSEEKLVRSLGSPQKLGKDLTATYYVEKAKTDQSVGNLSRAIWAVVGVSFFNILIVLGPFLLIATLILSFWIADISLISQVSWQFIHLVVHPESFSWFELFFSVTVSGIGILLILVVYPVTKFVIQLFIKYLAFNTRIVKGGTSDE